MTIYDHDYFDTHQNHVAMVYSPKSNDNIPNVTNFIGKTNFFHSNYVSTLGRIFEIIDFNVKLSSLDVFDIR